MHQVLLYRLREVGGKGAQSLKAESRLYDLQLKLAQKCFRGDKAEWGKGDCGVRAALGNMDAEISFWLCRFLEPTTHGLPTHRTPPRGPIV
ncbi:hypothetical protein VTG60DRAFT_5231 [Thermothelomyces hinnuleus]